MKKNDRDSAPENPLPAPHAAGSKDQNGDDAKKPIGLCLNCDERKSCRLPKAPGGVWFCEEYR